MFMVGRNDSKVKQIGGVPTRVLPKTGNQFIKFSAKGERAVKLSYQSQGKPSLEHSFICRAEALYLVVHVGFSAEIT
jgi:hypothetical protein